MVGFGPGPESAAEPARHAHQVSVIEALIGALQSAPPTPEATTINALWEVRIQDNAIHAVVAAFQEICVLLAQRVRHAAIFLQTAEC
jgi:hypothetical protein